VNIMSVVGFIGLGTMGRPMAKNVLKAGHSLVFYARRPEVIQEFLELGARAVENPAAVAEAAEFVITIVTADPELKEVVLGEKGLIHGAAPGKILLEMSTVSPDTEAALGNALDAKGMTLLDAPVSGGPWGAQAGTLAIMVGGPADAYARAQPVLAAMGKHLFHLGPRGAGQVCKLVNQMIGGGIMCLIGEGLALARKAGADMEQVASVIEVSSGNSTVFQARGKKFVLANNFVPGFMTELMRKDVRLALELGSQLAVPLPLAAVAFQEYTQAVAQGLGKEDFAAVAKMAFQAAGVTIQD